MIVADTNVIAYLSIPSPYTEMAEQLLLKDSDWIAPRLWRSELRNVLALYLRKSLMSFDEALQVQSTMEELLEDKEYEVSSLDILTLVSSSSCSAYDCEFVALAKSFNIQLITMDKKVAKAFPETAILLTAFVNDMQ
ncbi:type II toxin-antitoxin system VapC family toxin [bacterium AH-315-K03]|nr:type II toxin-antitoxin system VapC family toxin [bacterium AH-315-K03]